ncbi:MAG: hypothetical protein ABSF03_33255, partial [Streptosporangiaceae bacterium]
LREQAGRFGSAAAVEAAEIIAGRRAEGADFGAEAANGPQPPAVHDLYRARERVLEVDQAGGSPAGVAQAKMKARQTEAAYIQAEDRRMEDPAYRAEIEASYDSDRYPDLEAGW